jgi:hypothetical protein
MGISQQLVSNAKKRLLTSPAGLGVPSPRRSLVPAKVPATLVPPAPGQLTGKALAVSFLAIRTGYALKREPSARQSANLHDATIQNQPRRWPSRHAQRQVRGNDLAAI